MILRAYAKYLRQAGTTFSQATSSACSPSTCRSPGCWCACSSPGSTRPAEAGAGASAARRIAEEIRGAARRGRRPRPGPDPAQLPGPDPGHPADQLLPAAPRRQRAAGQPPYLVVKLDAAAVPELPDAAAQVRGVRLLAPAGGRAPALRARSPAAGCAGPTGGRTSAPRSSAWSRRRWSRTRSSCRPGPRAASSARTCRIRPIARRTRREVLGLLQDFISAMLDVTDNLRDGQVSRRRAWSGTTATTPTWWSPPTRAPPRSPTSPTRSREAYGFWLGDAFASGGSEGYDHKKMGITARGAWESVKFHFRHPGRGPGHRRVHRGRASATCPGTCSATACCCPRTSSWSPRSITGTCSSTPTPTRPRASPSGSGCSPCPGPRGPTTTGR